MAGAKETPRQKMIGMMYLVLTALLALNVSVDILDAFANLNDGMEISNVSISKKIAEHYSEFKGVCDNKGESAAEYWEKAEKVREMTDEIINYIEKDVKMPLVCRTENITEEEFLDAKREEALMRDISVLTGRRLSYLLDLKNVKAKDKYDEPTNFFINEKKAYELANKLDIYRSSIIEMLSEYYPNYAEKNKALDIHSAKYEDANGLEQDWENHNFYHMILAADIANLNRIINEIQSFEYDVIDDIWDRIGASDYKFNSLQARVIAKSTYVLQGSNYEAEVFVAANDTTNQFDVKYVHGTSSVANVSDDKMKQAQSVGGVVKLSFPAVGNGVQNYCGYINMPDPETGESVKYPFNASYTVAPPSVTIAPTQMMILYQGLKNPISVSSPGLAANQIEVSVSVGTIEKTSDGNYLVSVPSGQNIAVVSAYANVDGKRTMLGSYEFKIKRVPNPQATIAGSVGGKIDKSTLLAAGGIIPDMGDFEFGDYHFTITSYQCNTIVNGDYKPSGTINGGQFKGEVLNIINKAKRGDKLMFENIQAKGPDGNTRSLNSIIIEI